jgi:hypothetical protein
MAGGYRHVVDREGNLKSNQEVVDALETGGDVFEAIEEMYGMIWWLAAKAAIRVNPTSMIIAVDEARDNYELGLRIARGVNKT